MSTHLQTIILERERLLYPGKNLGAANMNIAELMTDKMSDINRTKNERIMRLEHKIKEVIHLTTFFSY